MLKIRSWVVSRKSMIVSSINSPQIEINAPKPSIKICFKTRPALQI